MQVPRYVWALGAAVLLTAPGVYYLSSPRELECKDLSPLAQEVMASLQDEPESWSSDWAYLRHNSGLSFWVASGAAALRPTQDHDHDAWQHDFANPTPEQSCVYAAYQNWREDRQYEPALGGDDAA